ncbi:MAG: DUF4159 domain-containing protein [Planctomycetes bacterium]|nr:DUF4159 domain-containing protein [Planctomycetota bacterium]
MDASGRVGRGVAAALAVALFFGAAPGRARAAEVTGADVARAVERGIGYLRAHAEESIAGYGQYQSGVLALRALALFTAGVDPQKDALLGSDLAAVAAAQFQYTYSVALSAMLLAAVDPVGYRARIEAMADWLVKAQNPEGTWTYGQGQRGSGDNSNTQFGVLGLYAAQEAGVAVPANAWERTVKFFTGTQNRDGGWGYTANAASISSMSAAGTASLLIAQNRLAGARACGEQPFADRIKLGLATVGKQFEAFLRRGGQMNHLYYYLYAVERVGILSGRKYLGGRDWYRDGASYLVREQQPDGSWASTGNDTVDTALAILYLAKGHTPLLVNKLEWEGDWNDDPSDLKNLLEYSTRKLGRRFSWQVVSTAEPAEELGYAPVLYLNGHTAPRLGPDAIEKLRAFVDGGGLIFAEACCGKPDFDRGVRELVERLFPGRKLERLPADHAVYRVQFKLDDPALKFLEGVTYACRTAVIYSPQDVSCGWDLGCPAKNPLSEEQTMQLGMNVLLYGMGNVPLRDKLDREGAVGARTEELQRDTFVFAQLRHGGDWNPDPHAWTRLRALLAEEQGVRCAPAKRALTPSDPNLASYPFLYLTGHEEFAWSDAERTALREHATRGGMLLVDCCCGKAEFDRAVRKELAATFPGAALVPVPRADPLRNSPYPVGAGRLSPAAAGGGAELLGIRQEGRWMVLYSPVALLCPVDGHPCPDCRSWVVEDASRLAANVVVYALTQ